MGMFGDDVKLQSKSSAGLQGGLDDSTEWADEKDMSWGTPKCHILEPENAPTEGTYMLAGQELQVADSAEYLGVTLRGTKIADDKNVGRADAAIRRIGMLQGAGINRTWVHSARLLEICRTFVYSVADYGIHLMNCDPGNGCKLSDKVELLDYKVVEYALGCNEKDRGSRRNGTGRIGGRLP